MPHAFRSAHPVPAAQFLGQSGLTPLTAIFVLVSLKVLLFRRSALYAWVCFTTVDVGTFLFIVLGILWALPSKYPVLSA